NVGGAIRALAACNSVPGTQLSGGSYLSGAHWSLSYPWHTSNTAYTHFNTPNKLSCVSTTDTATAGGCGMGCVQWGGPSGMIPANSNHPGGGTVGMADGSVKFIKDTIAPTTWFAIGTKAGGEVLSADSY